jgi:hypothetical protein
VSVSGMRSDVILNKKLNPPQLSRRGAIVKFVRLGALCTFLSSCRQQSQVFGQTEPRGWKNRQMIQSTRQLNCSLSDDGNSAVFSRLDTEQPSIALIDFNTNATKSFQINEEFERLEDLVISGDGKRIAAVVYNSGSIGESQIWIVNNNGVIEFKLIGLDRTKAKPCFSIDGNSLFFFADMRHQYLPNENLTEFRSTGDESLAVHKLDLNSQEITLVDLPILPFPAGAFSISEGSIVGVWNSDVSEPQFDTLPVDSANGLNSSRGYGGNRWQRNRQHMTQTFGEAQILPGGSTKFIKFNIALPAFTSSLDMFQATRSPCNGGFLAVLELYDPDLDPTPDLLTYPNFQPSQAPNYGLAWLLRDGQRIDVSLRQEFSSIPSAAGSRNRSRVIAWAGLIENQNIKFAAEVGFPWVKSEGSDWVLLDLKSNFKPELSIPIRSSSQTKTAEIPKLIDKNGVGRNSTSIFFP